jgi:hypothetical protein
MCVLLLAVRPSCPSDTYFPRTIQKAKGGHPTVWFGQEAGVLSIYFLLLPQVLGSLGFLRVKTWPSPVCPRHATGVPRPAFASLGGAFQQEASGAAGSYSHLEYANMAGGVFFLSWELWQQMTFVRPTPSTVCPTGTAR